MHHEEEMVLGQQTAEEMRGMKPQVLLGRETFGHQSHHRSFSSQGTFCCSKSPKDHQETSAHDPIQNPTEEGMS